jgi:RNA polymerase sigma-70 factor (ECF subfamily)
VSSNIHADGLIRRARDGDRDALGHLLEHYRGYLRISAPRRLQAPRAARMDASDVVQKTFLEAQRSFERFQGQNENQLLGWLRSILDHHLTDAVRDHLWWLKSVPSTSSSRWTIRG